MFHRWDKLFRLAHFSRYTNIKYLLLRICSCGCFVADNILRVATFCIKWQCIPHLCETIGNRLVLYSITFLWYYLNNYIYSKIAQSVIFFNPPCTTQIIGWRADMTSKLKAGFRLSERVINSSYQNIMLLNWTLTFNVSVNPVITPPIKLNAKVGTPYRDGLNFGEMKTCTLPKHILYHFEKYIHHYRIYNDIEFEEYNSRQPR